MKTIICAICGKYVERTGTRQKYCPECRIKVQKIYDQTKSEKQRRNRSKTDKREWDDLWTGDTPENIAICLDCPLGICMDESKYCRRKRKSKQKNRVTKMW